MNKPIFSFFEELILGDRINQEYSSFIELLHSNRCAFAKEYDEEKKIIYLYPFKSDGSGGGIEDPLAEPYPISFYDKFKKLVLFEEKQVKRKVTGGFEERKYDKDQRIFLNHLYETCISLIETYNSSKKDSTINEHPVILESLKRIKKAIEYHFEISNIDLPKSISDPLTFQRKNYRVQSFSQDLLVDRVKKLIHQPRFLNEYGEPKPTTIRDEILQKNLVESADDISDRALFDRIKDAIEEIRFYEAKTTS